jgi:uncharacterized linocin/CFP29 family protein
VTHEEDDMNHLLRDHAPVTDAAWAEIDQEAKRTLTHFLAGRKLIEFSGPKGWDHPGEPTGRIEPAGTLQEGAVQVHNRLTQPMMELRTVFELARAELDAIDRGACDVDLDPLIDAAKSTALAEDEIIFHGAAGCRGLTDASPHTPVEISNDYEHYPRFVAQGMARLQDAGVGGPYAIALGPRCYTGVIEESEMGGYPVLEHLRLILGGPVVRAQAVNGAVVVSQRGGDFEIVCGEDLSIGYLDHDAERVRLYIEESVTVRICSPEAAIHLAYP